MHEHSTTPHFPQDIHNFPAWVAKFGLTEPFGKCQCGCGNDAPIAIANHTKSGREKGKPSRFIHGHNPIVSPLKRFWSKVQKMPSGCWEWQAAKTPNGYGLFLVDRKLTYTHRFSYLLHNGELPDNLHVCHKCDNPSCCNPEHLFLGDDSVNNADMHAKGRGFLPPTQKGVSNNNAKLNPESVREIRKMRADGHTYQSIAERFNVSSAVAYAVSNHKTWKHVN